MVFWVCNEPVNENVYRVLLCLFELLHVLELDSLLNAAEIVVAGALARQESRGAHTRLDFPKRDDVHWLEHTLAHRGPDGSPQLSYIPVTITKHQPVERKY